MHHERPLATKTVFIPSDLTVDRPLRRLLRSSSLSKRMEEIQAELDAKEIPGDISYEEGKLLYRWAQRCHSKQTLVAVGALQGRSTAWLYHGAHGQAQLVVCPLEHHAGEKANYRYQLRKLGIEKQVQMHTHHAAETSGKPAEIDFLLIEGGKDRERIQKEVSLWFPRLKVGGILAFHDSLGQKNPEVHHVACSTLFDQPYFRRVRFKHSIIYATKTERTTQREKWAKKGIQQLLASR